jgi:hypothetical protein
MVDVILDIYYKDAMPKPRDNDGRHNFTEVSHPRDAKGNFTPTPVGTHYEAKHAKRTPEAKARRIAELKKRARARHKKVGG